MVQGPTPNNGHCWYSLPSLSFSQVTINYNDHDYQYNLLSTHHELDPVVSTHHTLSLILIQFYKVLFSPFHGLGSWDQWG